ncbi:putative PMR5 domain, PC-Esterase, protein trichome birefringence-like 3 [Rosa chinensis]|uniref:Putative PMR5 domain, PC-Esterase, protein trichome birefringence-like 3 n=1 Tax=Rosa chinensis TaxID=74649 RepID=A0A2P6R8Z2_ROSCH|nr:protein trichome birefringence-like 3 [Rosa chinensis]PRQ42908.1 putative PMR5 domain, PC-Esterase, protein trichome birefringence-like 3 [Rosa chinensis]
MSSGQYTTAGTMKGFRGKLHLPIIMVCSIALISLLFTERISIILSSNPFFKHKSCSRRAASVTRKNDRNATKEKIDDSIVDDRFVFDPEECNVENGKWVFNRSIRPFYSDRSCPYLDRQVSCVKNGRPDSDSDYRHWEWQPEDCTLPRFNPELMLQKLRNKRLMFVGDSLQRGQWQSLVCMVESIIPQNKQSMRRGRALSVFRAKEYNATIEFYWDPFLVESNSDLHIVINPKDRILKVDSVAKHAEHWTGVDILVFNTFVWWMSGYTIKSYWGQFPNGEEGYEELEAVVAYRIALKTWANWVDTNVNPNKTRVFFTTMSPTHMRSADWNNPEGMKCFNETKPYMKKGFWSTGADKRIMRVVVEVIKKMKVPVSVLNITQMSDYRVDAHTKVYTETGGKLLTDEQKADVLHNSDCIHWCLPGVPDTWNQIFLANL